MWIDFCLMFFIVFGVCRWLGGGIFFKCERIVRLCDGWRCLWNCEVCSFFWLFDWWLFVCNVMGVCLKDCIILWMLWLFCRWVILNLDCCCVVGWFCRWEMLMKGMCEIGWFFCWVWCCCWVFDIFVCCWIWWFVLVILLFEKI